MKEKHPASIPEGDFLKITKSDAVIDPAQKTALNRKGNQLLNEGKADIAKRIFLTTGYSDGLIRTGNYYKKNNDFLEALKMYHIAPDRYQKDELIEKFASVLQIWLNEK